MNRLIFPSRRIVYTAALQQCFFIPARAVLQCMIRGQSHSVPVQENTTELYAELTAWWR